jgi:hypothetical protein
MTVTNQDIANILGEISQNFNRLSKAIVQNSSFQQGGQIPEDIKSRPPPRSPTRAAARRSAPQKLKLLMSGRFSSQVGAGRFFPDSIPGWLNLAAGECPSISAAARSALFTAA